MGASENPVWGFYRGLRWQLLLVRLADDRLLCLVIPVSRWAKSGYVPEDMSRAMVYVSEDLALQMFGEFEVMLNGYFIVSSRQNV